MFSRKPIAGDIPVSLAMDWRTEYPLSEQDSHRQDSYHKDSHHQDKLAERADLYGNPVCLSGLGWEERGGV